MHAVNRIEWNIMENNFADLGLSDVALRAVDRLGYEAPTPVQAATIPLVLEGRDVIAAASTGTGKTAAFLLPSMDRLRGTKKEGRKPRILVVSPTRELAQQIAKTCMQVARDTGQYVTTVFGGSAYGPQIKDLKRGTDILIATPGRLNDLIDRGVAKLGKVEILVLDEADRMLDMGFLPAMETIIEQTPEERQTLLFSATIDKSITKGIGTLLKDPELVEIAHKGETAKTVKQFVMPIAHKNKYELLRAVLDEKGSDRVIVFTRTKNRTEECVEMLRDNGFSAESIHSDRSQIQRRKALENFRRGRTSILVATDVLARGIDVPDVDHVINVDLPDCPEDYVHRIGRTGRAGEEGFAISFVTRETRNALRDIEKLTNSSIPFMELENYETDMSVLEKPKRGARNGGGNRNGGSRYGNKQGGYQGNRSGDKRGSEGKRTDDKRGSYDRKEKSGDSRRDDRRPAGDSRRDDRRGSSAPRQDDRRGSFNGRRDDRRDNAGSNRSDNRRPAGEGRRDDRRDDRKRSFNDDAKRPTGDRKRNFDKKDRKDGGSNNYNNAAKRVSADHKKAEKAESAPKKQRSKHNKSTYDYSRFA